MSTILQALENQDADKRALAASLLWTSIIQSEPETLGYDETCSRLARRINDEDERVRTSAVMAIWDHCFGKPTCDLSLLGDEAEICKWLIACKLSNIQCNTACVELIGLLSRQRGSTFRDFFKILPRGPAACFAYLRGGRRWRFKNVVPEKIAN